MAETPKSPRLQLRWEAGKAPAGSVFEHDEFAWRCHYELVLPLGESDIRREIWKDGEEVGQRDELVIAVKGCSLRGAGEDDVPCVHRADGSLYYDPPYRDGAHAKWDAALLGGLPIYCVAPDGRFIERPADQPARGAA